MSDVLDIANDVAFAYSTGAIVTLPLAYRQARAKPYPVLLTISLALIWPVPWAVLIGGFVFGFIRGLKRRL